MIMRGSLKTLWTAVNRALLLVTIALIPFWWYQVLLRDDIPNIWYGYTSILMYASDAALALTLATWPLARAEAGRPWRWGPLPLGAALLSIILLSYISTAGSLNAGLTLYTSLHLTLLGGLYLYAVNELDGLGWAAVLLAAIVTFEGVLALVQFGERSTYPAGQLFMGRDAEILAAQSGASVVETASGARWLRAYGSVPHPNVLGGLLVAFLLPLAGWYLRGAGRWSPPLLMVILLGTAGVALTFSRSAWLGLATGGITLGLLAWRERGSDDRRAGRGLELALGMALVWLALGALFADLFFTRVGGLDTRLERRSVMERLALRDAALDVMRAGPLTGVGTGNAVLAEMTLAGRRWPLEPVHNVPLLAASEVGAPGGVAWLGVLVGLGLSLVRRRPGMDPLLWGVGAGAAALCVISLFDHYLWTHAPMRTLFWLWLGVWAAGAQARPDLLPPHLSADDRP